MGTLFEVAPVIGHIVLVTVMGEKVVILEKQDLTIMGGAIEVRLRQVEASHETRRQLLHRVGVTMIPKSHRRGPRGAQNLVVPVKHRWNELSSYVRPRPPVRKNVQRVVLQLLAIRFSSFENYKLPFG